MKEQIVIELEIDDELYASAKEILEKQGMTVEQAIVYFIEETVKAGDLPFPYDKAKLTDDEKIDRAAVRILKEYRVAFEELAK